VGGGFKEAETFKNKIRLGSREWGGKAWKKRQYLLGKYTETDPQVNYWAFERRRGAKGRRKKEG